ncbi:MAG: hypothetical protein AAB546_03725 [Patescibacteria group bacterium]
MLPLRNQTYQDDWAYIQSVRNFYLTGNLSVSDWLEPSTVFLIFWGSLFSKIFGFSIKTLHFANIALSYFGSCALFSLLKRLKISQVRCLLFTVFYFTFPWVFQFSYTFLSDTSYVSLLIISLYFYTLGLQNKRTLYYALGSLFASFSFTTRQLGFSPFLAIVITSAFLLLIGKRLKIKHFLAATLPFVIIFIIYFYWHQQPGNLTIAEYQIGLRRFSKEVLPFLFPLDTVRIGATYLYYATFIQRVLYLFHHTIGFFLPLFLIFLPGLKWRDGVTFLGKNIKPLALAFGFYLLLLFVEITIHIDRKTYQLEQPSLVTRYFLYPNINWLIAWKYLILASTPIWLTILAVGAKSTFNDLFTKNRILNRKLLKTIFACGLLTILFFVGRQYIQTFNSSVPRGSQYILKQVVSSYYHLLGTELEIKTTKPTVLIYGTFFVAFTVLFTIFSKYKFRKIPKIKPEKLFLILTFAIQFTATVIFPYFNWAQYIISFLPFAIIQLALATRNLKANYPLAVIIILLFSISSITATRNRYQPDGIRWEMAEKLVLEKNIEPANVAVGDESWLPWWYYEQTLQKYIADNNQDKYTIKTRSPWREVKPTDNCLYQFQNLSSYEIKTATPDLISDSGKNRGILFEQNRFGIYKECK